MAKIVFNNKNYNIDESALAPAMATLEAHLRSMAGGADPEPDVNGVAGLYQTGAIALYEEQGADAIEGMMIKSWEDLVANGTVHVEDGVVYSNFDNNTWANASSAVLVGDLILPNDGSITKLGDYHYWFDENNVYSDEGRIAFGNCTKLTGIIIPDSVISTGEYALMQCYRITYVNIPDNVTSIGAYTFSDCSGLTNITIPNNVTSIGDNAFNNCSGLTNITIPSSVTDIGSNVFMSCSNLTNIVISNSITSIEMGMFYNCSSLTNITIPDSITSIGSGAFKGCTNLTDITFEGTIEQWNAITFENNWNLNVPATYVQCSDGQVAL